MATYYRWRRSTINYILGEGTPYNAGQEVESIDTSGFIYESKEYSINGETITLSNPDRISIMYDTGLSVRKGRYCILGNQSYSTFVYTNYDSSTAATILRVSKWTVSKGTVWKCNSVPAPGTSQGYVYSTSSTAYPNGGVSGGYYYDQRTTVTSPTAPTGLTYPNPITTPSAAISWTAATSATDYPVSLYEVSYSTNGGSSWTVAGTTAEVNYSFDITPGTTSIMFRVRAQDSNGQWGGYMTGTASQVLLAPTLTVPQMVMQGQQATISWSAIEGADSYTLQRKANTDADWTQVYSGANQSYTETVGTWTSLQYRVQAVFDGTAGGWATSDPIQIVSASALVISGTDGDLGTLVNDVPYSISSDQTSPTIDVTVEVNGGEYAAFQATSGQTYTVGVLDLPTGTGSIVITATTEVSSSPVTVTRTWTYSKTAQTFPNSGSVATLTKEGNVVYPETLIEAVRAAMTPWGGNLSTALNLLKNAALFNRTKQPKYSEVTVSMANVTEGQIISLPKNGVMRQHYVAKINYESGLNGDGRILIVDVHQTFNAQWNSPSGYNTYASSSLDSALQTPKGQYSEDVQTAMGTTKFYYTPGGSNNDVTTLERSAFQLSETELGLSGPGINTEGSVLPIADILRQFTATTGSAISQFTRSPNTTNSGVWIVSENGSGSSTETANVSGYGRIAFTLPSTFSATYYVDTQGTIHDQQEYTEAGDWLDVWGNAIPAVKMETGSYVGTGTSGSSNPTILTFPFEPKVVFIGDATSSPSNLYYGTYTPLIRGVKTAISQITTDGAKDILYVSWDGNTVSYYSNGGTDFVKSQLNATGVTYNYVAIG